MTIVENLFVSVLVKLVFGQSHLTHYVCLERTGGVEFDKNGTVYRGMPSGQKLYFRAYNTDFGSYVQLGTLSDPALFQQRVDTLHPLCTGNITPVQLAVAAVIYAAAETYERNGHFSTLAERDYHTRQGVLLIPAMKERWHGTHKMEPQFEKGSHWELIRDFCGPMYDLIGG